MKNAHLNFAIKLTWNSCGAAVDHDASRGISNDNLGALAGAKENRLVILFRRSAARPVNFIPTGCAVGYRLAPLRGFDTGESGFAAETKSGKSIPIAPPPASSQNNRTCVGVAPAHEPNWNLK